MLDLTKIPFIQARWFTAVNGSPRHIRMIVLHSMEAPEKGTTAEATARYFASLDRKASAHYCLTPNTRILCDDLIWRAISEVPEGTGILGCEEYIDWHNQKTGRSLQKGKVLKTDIRKTQCIELNLSDGRNVVCSTDHLWLTRPPTKVAGWDWESTDSLVEGSRICAPLTPWDVNESRDAGYIAGILDGEGCWASTNDLSFAQKGGKVLDASLAILTKYGIPYRLHERECGTVIIGVSGLQGNLKLLGQSRPTRLFDIDKLLNRALRSRTHTNYVTVDSITQVGLRKVVSIATDLRTFFAEGMVSHNCVDNDSIVQCVQCKDVAYAAPNANSNGIHIEMAGYARQTRDEWTDAYGLAMLDNVAALCGKVLMPKYEIPLVSLKAADLLAASRGSIPKFGFTTHAEVTKAFNPGGHWDPGPGFPMDILFQKIRAIEGLSENLKG